MYNLKVFLLKKTKLFFINHRTLIEKEIKGEEKERKKGKRLKEEIDMIALNYMWYIIYKGQFHLLFLKIFIWYKMYSNYNREVRTQLYFRRFFS